MEGTKRKIEEADDVDDVTASMINLNIATKGCKTLQQMTDRNCENQFSLPLPTPYRMLKLGELVDTSVQPCLWGWGTGWVCAV